MTLGKKHFTNVMDDKHAIEQSHRDESFGRTELRVLIIDLLCGMCNLNLIFFDPVNHRNDCILF